MSVMYVVRAANPCEFGWDGVRITWKCGIWLGLSFLKFIYISETISLVYPFLFKGLHINIYDIFWDGKMVISTFGKTSKYHICKTVSRFTKQLTNSLSTLVPQHNPNT